MSVTSQEPRGVAPANALGKYSVVINTDDLMSRCFGNIDFIIRILSILKERCDEEMIDLQQAAEELDVERVYAIAHRLKGALANAAASELSSLADQICTSLSTENIRVTKEKIQQLRKGWDELSALIDQDTNTAA